MLKAFWLGSALVAAVAIGVGSTLGGVRGAVAVVVGIFAGIIGSATSLELSRRRLQRLAKEGKGLGPFPPRWDGIT